MPILLTQNICGAAPFWSHRRKSLARQFARLRPDVIGLQEVHASNTSGESSQAHELADLVGGYETYFIPARIPSSGHCEGVAILVRHPIHTTSMRKLSLDRRDILERWGQRVVLHALIELPDGPVDVFVTHLSLSLRARARTILELLAFAAEERSRSSSRGAILMGDLNARPGEPSLAMLENAGGWFDTWKHVNAPRSRGGTYPASAPFFRLDYIFAQPRTCWQVHRCERQPFSGSDHRGLAAWLNLDVRPSDDEHSRSGGP
jgi:endonuclease/exonuclease/phosphatase family metal-dependent hydrolase